VKDTIYYSVIHSILYDIYCYKKDTLINIQLHRLYIYINTLQCIDYIYINKYK